MSSSDDPEQKAQPLTLLSLSYHNLITPSPRGSKRSVSNTMETVNVPELVERLGSDEPVDILGSWSNCRAYK